MINYLSVPEERLKILKRDSDWRTELKKFCDAKINLGEDIEIVCNDPLMLMRLKLVFQAFGRGFDFDTSMSLLDEDFNLDIIDISSYTKSKERMADLRGRVIGTKGKIKNIIEKKTETRMEVYGKTISLIGRFESTQKAREVIELILVGRKHGTALKFLQ